MINYKGNKSFRLLRIREHLEQGGIISKMEIVASYNISEKTAQRDIDDLRAYYAERYCDGEETTILYDKSRNGYYLKRSVEHFLNKEEILAISKIILESRAFCKEELEIILSKLLKPINNKDSKKIENLIGNERFHYMPLSHGKKLIYAIWNISEYINKSEIIKISYIRKDGVSKQHVVKPVAILFSEYYFYLIAYMADGSKEFPTIFRVDRIENIQGMKEIFYIPYKDKFSESEFRKRVQFMYSGELKVVHFKYLGKAVDAVLDRLPTAEILSKDEQGYLIRVEVYGEGIDMWLRSQGNMVEVV